MEIVQFISICSSRKKVNLNVATTKLFLLPSFELGSKSLLTTKKKEFLGLVNEVDLFHVLYTCTLE